MEDETQRPKAVEGVLPQAPQRAPHSIRPPGGMFVTRNMQPAPPQNVSATGRPPAAAEGPDALVPALITALRLAKRAAEIELLHELYFFLTNDTRSLFEFDRSALLLHVGGTSFFAATNNQVSVEKASRFFDEWNRLAGILATHEKLIFLPKTVLQEDPPGSDLPDNIKESLKRYIAFSKCSYLLCIPLNYSGKPLGHLVFEFMDAPLPHRAQVEALMTISSPLAVALANRWLEHVKPGMRSTLALAGGGVKKRTGRMLGLVLKSIVATVAIFVVLFHVPVPFTVGGEAEIVSRKAHTVFPAIDGLIREVLVREGDVVKKGQLLAAMDPKEIDFEIRKAKSEGGILEEEIAQLAAEATEDPAKWAKKKLSELKRQGVVEKLEYLEWRRGFLSITAPVAGTVVTKDIETLKGKSLKTGEAFCEIAAPRDLSVEVRVPEERASYVEKGQRVLLYLNTDPSKGCELTVDKISPMAEVVPRLGNVFKVKAYFPDAPDYVKLGMKGIGKIEIATTTVWFVLTQRIRTRWNQFSLYF